MNARMKRRTDSGTRMAGATLVVVAAVAMGGCKTPSGSKGAQPTALAEPVKSTYTFTITFKGNCPSDAEVTEVVRNCPPRKAGDPEHRKDCAKVPGNAKAHFVFTAPNAPVGADFVLVFDPFDQTEIPSAKVKDVYTKVPANLANLPKTYTFDVRGTHADCAKESPVDPQIILE